MGFITKNIQTKANDVDGEGRVVIAINAIGNEDSDGDISMSGSFDKTLKDDFNRLKWFLNHNTSILLGVPVEGKEEDGLIKMVSQFNMKKQIARDTYEDYKLYAEHGKTLEHSVGVNAEIRNKSNDKEVLQWKLWEYSTLTNWGANENTPLLDIKNMDIDSVKNHLQLLEKALTGNYSEARLKSMETALSMIKKAVIGEMIVKCPCCGLAFDYNTVPEETLRQQVVDAVNMHAGWMVDEIAHQEVGKLEESIRTEVMSIIESKKSLEFLTNHVRCPRCYGMVTQGDIVVKSNSGKIDIKSLVSKIR